jgi:dolichol-phosphate mannosyltransferase
MKPLTMQKNEPNDRLSTDLPGRGLISIILATYNEGENIKEMIAAILSYLPDPVEVIVVDDNSPDRTWQIAGDMGDPRVKVIRRTKARGLASAINRGIIESRGEFLGWMDADMCHPPELLPKMLAQLSGCDVVIGSTAWLPVCLATGFRIMTADLS